MTRLCTMFLAALALAPIVFAMPQTSVAQDPARGDKADLPRRPAEPDALRALGAEVAMGGSPGSYVAACSQCHGMDGAGDEGGAFPRLAGQSGWYLYKSLADYRRGQRTHAVMSPIATSLDDTQMRAVASYFASLDGTTRAAPRPFDGDRLQAGAAISAIGVARDGIPACSSCHGPSGTGGAPTVPSLAGQPAAYLEYQLLAWKTGRRSGDPLNVMSVIARAMSHEQIRAASAYFAASAAPAQASSLGVFLPATLVPQSQSSASPTGPTGPMPPYLSGPSPERTTR